MKKTKLTLVMAAAVASTFLTAISTASAAITNGYVLSDALADGARGVTVLSATTAEAGLNATVVLKTSETLAATAADNVSLEISGPATFTDYTAAGSNPAATTLTNLGKTFTFTATTSSDVGLPTNIKAVVSGTGTITITQKKKVGALISVIDTKTIYVGSIAKANVFSAANSLSSVQDTSTLVALTTNADVATATSVLNGGVGYVDAIAKDAYDATLTTSGVLQATATNGAIVAWDTTPVTEVGFAAKTGVSGVLYVKQGGANLNKPVSTTITVSFNGTNFASKTISFGGQASTILVTDAKVAQSGGARTATYNFVVKDSAGNQLAGITPVADTTKYTSQVTAVSVAGASSATAVQTGGWTCAATSGSSIVRLAYTLNDGTTIYSNDFVAACGQSVNKYTATLDKAKYAPGEIATLTISAKDISGAKVADVYTVGAGVAISGGSLTAVTAPTSADTFSNGSKTYKFTVGNTTGSFNLVVDLPAYVATDSAKTVSYSIADGATSNTDVLKGITDLITVLAKQLSVITTTVSSKKTIACVKGKILKKVSGISPVCPKGYKKK